MSKTNMNIIILLMSLACLGLMGFQFYWVTNVLKINRERFEQNVFQAMAYTADKLEKSETSEILLKSLARDTIFRQTLFQKIEPIQLQITRRQVAVKRPSMVDSLLRQPIPQISQTFQKLIATKEGEVKSFEDIEKYLDMPPSEASSIFTPDEMQILLQEKEKYLDLISKQDRNYNKRSYAADRQELMIEEYNVSRNVAETIMQVNMKLELVDVVIHQLLSQSKQHILARVDTSVVKKEIQDQLHKRGIHQPFELGILDSRQEEVISVGNVNDENRLINSKIRAELFPSDLMGFSNFLVINFPNQKSHLLQQIWLPLLSSLVFLGIIVCCFIYAVQVIIKQKKLSEIKNDFINNMTHEFKTPISTVSLAIEALQEPELAHEERIRTKYLGIIKDENKRLGSQVEQVLQAAALDKKDFKLKVEEINLESLILSVKEQFSLIVEKRGGEIQVDFKANAPYMEGDKFHLANILSNLLDNANKYSKQAPRIRILVEENVDHLIISIKDSGIGMSKDAQKKIFDKFYRVPTGNVHDVKGFGLGLSYVKTMVEAHKGTVYVDSDFGKGSTFTINLPKKQ
ncbi:sensor histidine kinase [Pleomorphovibrio marinus]|uniref:sensor histidine kinase n=1 Tax=Pleomorphovibrio marinus TaxID=2164132 RepID=UPI000E0C31DC|nr:HAMP domain-containing sensor histidine kinase [Pleomorphovibrio marinus]